MENVSKETTSNKRGVTLAERFKELEGKVKIMERAEETEKKQKKFRWPLTWKQKMKKSTRKGMEEQMLVFFLNKKNEIETPRFMPIFDGNMIVYKNKPYEFDPRAVWTVRGMRKNPRAYIIKEIDRKAVKNKSKKIIYKDSAVSNLDLDEIRARGDSTESDEFLIKAALKAQKSEQKKAMKTGVIVIVGLVVVGLLIWALTSSGAA